MTRYQVRSVNTDITLLHEKNIITTIGKALQDIKVPKTRIRVIVDRWYYHATKHKHLKQCLL